MNASHCALVATASPKCRDNEGELKLQPTRVELCENATTPALTWPDRGASQLRGDDEIGHFNVDPIVATELSCFGYLFCLLLDKEVVEGAFSSKAPFVGCRQALFIASFG